MKQYLRLSDYLNARKTVNTYEWAIHNAAICLTTSATGTNDVYSILQKFQRSTFSKGDFLPKGRYDSKFLLDAKDSPISGFKRDLEFYVTFALLINSGFIKDNRKCIIEFEDQVVIPHSLDANDLARDIFLPYYKSLIMKKIEEMSAQIGDREPPTGHMRDLIDEAVSKTKRDFMLSQGIANQFETANFIAFIEAFSLWEHLEPVAGKEKDEEILRMREALDFPLVAYLSKVVNYWSHAALKFTQQMSNQGFCNIPQKISTLKLRLPDQSEMISAITLLYEEHAVDGFQETFSYDGLTMINGPQRSISNTPTRLTKIDRPLVNVKVLDISCKADPLPMVFTQTGIPNGIAKCYNKVDSIFTSAIDMRLEMLPVIDSMYTAVLNLLETWYRANNAISFPGANKNKFKFVLNVSEVSESVFAFLLMLGSDGGIKWDKIKKQFLVDVRTTFELSSTFLNALGLSKSSVYGFDREQAGEDVVYVYRASAEAALKLMLFEKKMEAVSSTGTVIDVDADRSVYDDEFWFEGTLATPNDFPLDLITEASSIMVKFNDGPQLSVVTQAPDDRYRTYKKMLEDLGIIYMYNNKLTFVDRWHMDHRAKRAARQLKFINAMISMVDEAVLDSAKGTSKVSLPSEYGSVEIKLAAGNAKSAHLYRSQLYQQVYVSIADAYDVIKPYVGHSIYTRGHLTDKAADSREYWSALLAFINVFIYWSNMEAKLEVKDEQLHLPTYVRM